MIITGSSRHSKELVEIGNTVLVVEHDKDIMLASDYIITLAQVQVFMVEK